MLGLEEALTAPHLAEGPRRYAPTAIRELLGGEDAAVARAVVTGLAGVDGGEIVVANPQLLDVGLELLEEGFCPGRSWTSPPRSETPWTTWPAGA